VDRDAMMALVGRGGAMARLVFVTWDGGGNVSVALGIASTLLARGHEVTILGPASLRGLIENTGVSYAELGVSPPPDPSFRTEYLIDVVGSTDLAAALRLAIEDLDPDGMVIDCNLSWALELSVAVPAAVLVHTALGLYLPVWQPVIDAANRRRLGSGLAPFKPAADSWSSHEAVIVASLLQFDRVPRPLPANVTYVGPIVRTSGTGPSITIAPDQTSTPLVLISYSTDRLQNSPERLQEALDGLAGLPVRVLASTSGTFEPKQLSVPPNATVVDDLRHDQVMAMAQAIVTHGGHGTTLAALCHGRPVVCVPGLGRDQVPIARRVAELGVGVALVTDSTAGDIGGAVSTVLRDRSYRERAREFKRRCGDTDGATAAAEILERALVLR
jgi:UDP:flavonoid glycosyltransferase YjiC (YdhE family)